MTMIQEHGVAVSAWMWTRKTLSMTILSSQETLSPYIPYFIFCLCHCIVVGVMVMKTTTTTTTTNFSQQCSLLS